MAGFPGNGPWPEIKKDLDRATRRPVVAVVAFIGRDAPSVMPLRQDDTLVCDASPLAVKRGLTSVAALRTFRRRGVQLYSVQGLHAKVIASPTSAWIGSANASRNSRDKLIEAATRVTGDPARRLYRWTCSLVTEDRELSAADLKELSAIKVDRFRAGPVIDSTPLELPKSLKRLWIVGTGNDLTERERRTAEQDRGSARSAAFAAGLPTHLDFIWWQSPAPDLKPGEWFIDIRNGHVRYPARVARIRPVGRDIIVWHAVLRTTRRPAVQDLRALEPGTAPDENGEFEQYLIRGDQRTRAVLNLFH